MRVVLLWHMHQPDYRVGGRFVRPWVYLHALAGYSDMAVRLEASASMRAVVNFTPVLIDQLEDYDRRLRRWRRDGTPVGDSLLDALIEPPVAGPARDDAMRACLPTTDSPRPARHPRYRALAEAATRHDPAFLSDGDFADLLVWSHLAWLGESARGSDPRMARLFEQGAGFDRPARHALVDRIADVVGRVLPRWRALAADGRVELATSPYYHPLAPLLLDFEAARERAPSLALPRAPYPGGASRLRWQLAEGRARFETAFGHAATGCWPPEAAVSDATLAELATAGFAWTASSRAVLEADPYRLYRHDATGLHCAFRDDGLSDRIGFEYQHWQAADAVRDLVQHLENIAREPGRELALIALDGENPWEFFRDEGAGFLAGLYETLSGHERLRPATMRDCLRELAAGATPLPRLRGGSWVHGELLTWIGHPEKNRAWEWLIEAKRRFDERGADDPALAHRLGACEGSDWFWWPGVHNPSASVSQFDSLYRAHLSELYRALGASPPEALSHPFATGVGHEVAAGGTMQRST
jgi:alpha-amylase/alpha-mannosidase (GH57 family)